VIQVHADPSFARTSTEHSKARWVVLLAIIPESDDLVRFRNYSAVITRDAVERSMLRSMLCLLSSSSESRYNNTVFHIWRGFLRPGRSARA
jgi:hypothetical protein